MDIERVDNFKYPGIYLDEILHWNKHVEYVCNSLIKFFVILKQIKCKVHLIIIKTIKLRPLYNPK